MYKTIQKAISVFIIAAFIHLPARTSYALPEGGSVASGSATFDSSTVNTLNINQSSDRAIINYNSFSIAKPETVNFNQPNASSIALNRVMGGNPSEILGVLNANGRIFLVNPNGILFGPDAVVDTAGMLASTLPMTTSDCAFMNPATNSFYFEGTSLKLSPGAVINQGLLTAPGGFVGLLGYGVQNSGTILADTGTIALACGDMITVSLDAANLINVAVASSLNANPEDAQAGIMNSGTLNAENGRVALTSRVVGYLFDQAINNSGIIAAKQILMDANGDIVLTSGIEGHGVRASAQNDDAVVDIVSAGGDIVIDSTEVMATAEQVIDSIGPVCDLDAEIYLQTRHPDDIEEEDPELGAVTITDSKVIAEVKGQGRAGVYIYDECGELDLGSDIEGILGLVGSLLGGDWDIEDAGGPVDGPVTITNSEVKAIANSREADNTAAVYINSETDINLSGGQILAQESTGMAGVAILSDTSITSDNCDISALVSGYEDFNLAGVALVADNLTTSGAAGVNASVGDGLAAVLGLGYGSVNAQGPFAANGNYGYGLAALLSGGDVLAGDLSAYGDGNVVPYLEYILYHAYFFPSEGATSLALGNQYNYGAAALAGSYLGNIYLGKIDADLVAAVALTSTESTDGPMGSSIFDVAGDVKAHLLFMLAGQDIGTAEAPITTDADILAAYSYDTGDIYVANQNPDEQIELGLYLPMYLTDSEGRPYEKFFGMSVAANDGIVHVESPCDIVINSVLTPRGGTFVRSLEGSIYAGRGWLPICYGKGDYDPEAYFGILPMMDLSETDWADEYDITGMFPYWTSYPVEGTSFNLVSGGQSYLSSYEGTIGVGVPYVKDPEMSGAVAGVVQPGVEAVTGVDPAPDIDREFGDPSGYVIFDEFDSDGEGNQIWPAALSPSPLSADNPLVVVALDFGYPSAVREGFSTTAALTLQFAGPTPPPPVPPVPPDTSSQSAAGWMREYIAYYEVLVNYRVLGFEPILPTLFYGYHPLATADMAAFDNVDLDAGAYDFISDNIRLKKKPAPFFGEVK